MSKGCSGFFVACMDFRIQDVVEVLYRQLTSEYGSFDRAQFAGSVRNVGLLRDQLAISISLHKPTVLVLTAHADCGYGTTMADLVRVLDEIRREKGADHIILGFWFEQTLGGEGVNGWTYTEVSPLP